MSNELKLLQVERSIEQSKRLIKLDQALKRLQTNADYKLIIEQGYLTDEAVRLVHAKADVALQSPAKQEAVIRDIDAIGSFAEFIRGIRTQAEIAEKTLPDDEFTRDELRAGN